MASNGTFFMSLLVISATKLLYRELTLVGYMVKERVQRAKGQLRAGEPLVAPIRFHSCHPP